MVHRPDQNVKLQEPYKEDSKVQPLSQIMGEKLAGEPAQQPGDASQIQNHI